VRLTKTTPDVAFHIERAVGNEEAAERSGAGINVMSYPAFSGVLKQRGVEIEHAEYLSFFEELGWALADRGIETRIFTTGASGDLRDAKAVLNRLNGITNINPKVTHLASAREFRGLVGALRYVVASRMHAGIAAHASGANVLALDWDDKVRPCWEMIGKAGLVLPPDVMRADGAGARVAERLLGEQDGFDRAEAERAIDDGLRDCLQALCG